MGRHKGRTRWFPCGSRSEALRYRLGPHRPIFVFHIDQPTNDFNAPFEILDADHDRYVLDEPNVFPAAIGRSFYENVLQPGSVHFGWCSYAAVWLSRIPALIPDHFIPFRSTGTLRAEFDRQGAEDWQAFLSLRARELRPGGRLVVVLPALADDGLSGFENIMDQANAVLAEMVAGGAIAAEERARMVLGSYPRRKNDLLAPFAHDGQFQHLTVEDFEMAELRDAAWTNYERDGNREALAISHALFFRSIFMPSLGSALARVRAGDTEALHIFGDHLEAGLKRRLATQPTPMHSLVQTIVLAKRA
jgi:hypothetical protein